MPHAMISIRGALVDDARAIARVHVAAWRSTYQGIVADEILGALSEDDRTRRWSELLQRSDQVAWVAEVEGRGIVGCINGGPEREGREDYRGELYSIYVLAEWQAKGIGRRLTAALARWLIDDGFGTMLAWVLEANPATRFYESLGGKIVDKKAVQIGTQTLGEVAFGWDDAGMLVSDARA